MKREAISKTKNLDAVIGAPQSNADFLGSVLVENLNRLEKTVYKKLCSGFEKTLEEAVLVIFDALYESKELYLDTRKMLLNEDVMKSESVRQMANINILRPGHSLILRFLGIEKRSFLSETSEAKRLSFHLWGLINESIMTLSSVNQNQTEEMGLDYFFIRSSLKNSARDVSIINASVIEVQNNNGCLGKVINEKIK